MPTFIAVEFKEQEALVVRAEAKQSEPFIITDAITVPLSDLLHDHLLHDQLPHNELSQNETTQAHPEQEEFKTNTDDLDIETHTEQTRAIPTQAISTHSPLELIRNSIKDISIAADSVLVIIPGHHALFKSIELPFNDQRTIDQVLPLQLQDGVPFDVDNFIIDATVIGKQDNNQFKLLASLIPEQDVINGIENSKALKLDPKLITTHTACLLGLTELFPNKLVGSYIIAHISENLCSLGIFTDDKLQFIRAFPVGAHHEEQFDIIIQEIRCAIAKVFRETQKNVARCYLLNSAEISHKISLQALSQELDIRVELLDPSEVIKIADGVSIHPQDLSWTLGLLGEELRSDKKHRKSINFRRGNYAYRPLIQNIINATKNEVFYLLLIITMGISWCALAFITTYNLQSELEHNITKELQTTLPGELITNGTEVDTVQQKTTELEEELRLMGSLSSVSFLEILKGLTTALPESMDIKVDSVQMSKERLEIKGSVKDYKTLGKLNGTLEAQSSLFCKVAVDTKSQQFGTNRVQFSADVQLCE